MDMWLYAETFGYLTGLLDTVNTVMKAGPG